MTYVNRVGREVRRIAIMYAESINLFGARAVVPELEDGTEPGYATTIRYPNGFGLIFIADESANGAERPVRRMHVQADYGSGSTPYATTYPSTTFATDRLQNGYGLYGSAIAKQISRKVVEPGLLQLRAVREHRETEVEASLAREVALNELTAVMPDVKTHNRSSRGEIYGYLGEASITAKVTGGYASGVKVTLEMSGLPVDAARAVLAALNEIEESA